jgi:hypothetical protein
MWVGLVPEIQEKLCPWACDAVSIALFKKASAVQP